MRDGEGDMNATARRGKGANSLRVAYIGRASGTSLHRARAMERLGHTVSLIDPYDFLPRSVWVSRWLFHTGGAGVGFLIDRPIVETAARSRPNLIWVDQGDFLGASLINSLRSFDVPIVNYTIDDPFGSRDGRRFDHYLQALPYYDLVVVMREQNVAEAYGYGARKVLRVWMSADEVAHCPREISEKDLSLWSSDVCFVGTWYPERGPFMAELIRAGIPLSIWGDRWQKAKEWPLIAPYWRGPGVYDDETYARIIQSAKICLGLLSKGNRDCHTTRSMEIPALGGLLCAERTDEHLALYRNGIEAVFWEYPQECAKICFDLLSDSQNRRNIAELGRAVYHKNGKNNQYVLTTILKEI